MKLFLNEIVDFLDWLKKENCYNILINASSEFGTVVKMLHVITLQTNSRTDVPYRRTKR